MKHKKMVMTVAFAIVTVTNALSQGHSVESILKSENTELKQAVNLLKTTEFFETGVIITGWPGRPGDPTTTKPPK